ncbi:gluconate 2-dehydrogenase subunit 3 family protein [Alteribacillus iranensis]|uniref:Gluconate 2-dehydrogenase gamma chain n=1 Tax=Alteribacillus iranensis TaxID=930128 RepID=A0A1I2EP18_9BACI|nr:gluconate 2-dehydrogenase subunit 3 family protein [Alteribacillus iranensis]SFE94236.1 gluconate 2-dehydrogenase gamma chain [Alteribacillus iranensis]
MAEESTDNKMSRRQFLKNSGYVAGGVVGGGIIGGLVTNQFQSGAPTQDQSQQEGGQATQDFSRALTYFSRREDFDVLSQMTELIYPSDDNGPGAIELGAAFYIDKQLSGAWGHNAREYMQGPFHEGEPTQGYQSRLKRHELIFQGIQKVKQYSQSNYDASFLDLEEEQQIEILTAFENGEVEIDGAPNEQFFALIRAATLEGVYADPLYGGNRNMDGWRMKEYPGNKMSYINEIDSGEFYDEEPSSLNAHMDQ